MIIGHPMRQASILCWITALLTLAQAAPAAESSLIDWHSDERSAFEQARSENKPVLLYLEAVWCHWCHVIDRETYGNDAVAALINAAFVPLRIDQDSRPDLANRYRNFGWPATIFLTPDGVDMVKRQGYIAPEPMRRLLQAIVDDPSPEAAAALNLPEVYQTSSSLDETVQATLEQRHLATFDPALGGLRSAQKLVDRDSVEWDLVLAIDGDPAAESRARKTLDAALALIDPVWGGVYQYSTHGDWQHPHFEKLATGQGEYLRIYALAYAALDEPSYLNAARQIESYLMRFLINQDGVFAASQDSDLIQGRKASDYFALDDAGRRALGIPRIDEAIYSRENGAIIEGLATLAEVTRDQQTLATAERAARWIMAHRGRDDGGFLHGPDDPAGPYLGDDLRMGRALLALYRVTADQRWLHAASTVLDRIGVLYPAAQAGYLAASPEGALIRPVPQLDENLSLIRFANLTHHYTGKDNHREIAEIGMRFVATPEVALSRITEAGVLLANRELNRDPLHLTVVGPKADPQAQRLHHALLDQPGWYKRLEWWDRDEGPLPRDDIGYPTLDRSAAFVCTENRCSLPLWTPERLDAFLQLGSP